MAFYASHAIQKNADFVVVATIPRLVVGDTVLTFVQYSFNNLLLTECLRHVRVLLWATWNFDGPEDM